MLDALVSGLFAGYGVAIPVGAIGALLVSLPARISFTVGASATLGVATADGLYAVVTVLGGAAITGVTQPIASPLPWLAMRGATKTGGAYRLDGVAAPL